MESELRAAYEPLLKASVDGNEPAKLRPALRLDEHNNAIWIRMPRGCVGLELVDSLSLWHPKDRLGKTEAGAFSTPAIDEATDDYRRACSEASRAVRQELGDLATRLQVCWARKSLVGNDFCARNYTLLQFELSHNHRFHSESAHAAAADDCFSLFHGCCRVGGPCSGGHASGMDHANAQLWTRCRTFH